MRVLAEREPRVFPSETLRARTNRFTETVLGWISRHEVHCTLKVYQKGLSWVSFGRKLVTLETQGGTLSPAVTIRTGKSQLTQPFPP